MEKKGFAFLCLLAASAIGTVRISMQQRIINTRIIKLGSVECSYIDSKTEYPASPPSFVTVKCNCNKGTKICYTSISWTQFQIANQHPVISYLLTFYECVDDDCPSVCYRVSQNQTKFNFTGNEMGIDVQDWDSFSVISEPVIKKTLQVHHYYATCPQRLSINDMPENVEISYGDRYQFNCTVSGVPLPAKDEITWEFQNRNRNITIEELEEDKYIQIYKGSIRSTLTITKARLNHSGTYICKANNFLDSKAVEHGSLIVRETRAITVKEYKVIIISGTVGVFVIIIILLLLLWHFLRKRNRVIYPDKSMEIYISHYTLNKYKQEELVKFAYHWEVNFPESSVILDLTKQNEINQKGGLSQWVPNAMLKADKILLVLSEEYLDAIKYAENGTSGDKKGELVLKALAEFTYIKDLLHHQCQQTGKLIICQQDGKPKDLPPVFQDRTFYPISNLRKETKGNNMFIRVLSSTPDTNVLHP